MKTIIGIIAVIVLTIGIIVNLCWEPNNNKK